MPVTLGEEPQEHLEVCSYLLRTSHVLETVTFILYEGTGAQGGYLGLMVRKRRQAANSKGLFQMTPCLVPWYFFLHSSGKKLTAYGDRFYRQLIGNSKLILTFWVRYNSYQYVSSIFCVCVWQLLKISSLVFARQVPLAPSHTMQYLVSITLIIFVQMNAGFFLSGKESKVRTIPQGTQVPLLCLGASRAGDLLVWKCGQWPLSITLHGNPPGDRACIVPESFWIPALIWMQNRVVEVIDSAVPYFSMVNY